MPLNLMTINFACVFTNECVFYKKNNIYYI